MLRNALLFSCLFMFAALALPAAQSKKPNIIFIMLDDLGPADLGVYGSKVIQTPNIDRLAAEGMRFTQSYSGCSVCAPTRSTLMTGKHMGRTTVRGNSGGIPLRDADMTVAEMLKQSGYATGGFGKWGIGELGTAGVPERQGFDRFFGYYQQVHAHYFYPDYLIDTGKKVPLPNEGFYKNKQAQGGVSIRNPETGKDAVFSSYLIFDKMKEFIRSNKDRSFFCYAPWTIPHAHFEIPQTDPAWQIYKDKPWTDEEKGFAAYCTLADRLVGETVALLKELGIEENTAIFFCSDNGAPNTSKVLNSSGGLRGEKGKMYEGGIRIPFIVRWPARVKPGRVSDTPIYLPDVFPTLAEMIETKSRALRDVDGLSLLPELVGKKKLPDDRYLYWEWNGAHFAPEYIPKYQAVRRAQWKLVRHELNDPWELYDLSNDQHERDNLAEENPKVVAKLSRWIEKNREPHLPQIEPSKPEGQRWR